jgi:hypothetical protein
MLQLHYDLWYREKIMKKCDWYYGIVSYDCDGIKIRDSSVPLSHYFSSLLFYFIYLIKYSKSWKKCK